MQITSASGTERNLAIELILEDVPGGGVVEKDDFKTASTGMKEGALLGIASDGIYHLTKTAMLVNSVATEDTAVVVYNNHEFKAGDYFQNTGNTASGTAITSIAASGAGCDVLNCTYAGPALSASGVIIQAATGTARALGFLYSPVAIATNPVDLTADNTGCGLLVRGRVRKSQLPYAVDSTIQALFPLIRFV